MSYIFFQLAFKFMQPELELNSNTHFQVQHETDHDSGNMTEGNGSKIP